MITAAELMTSTSKVADPAGFSAAQILYVNKNNFSDHEKASSKIGISEHIGIHHKSLYECPHQKPLIPRRNGNKTNKASLDNL